MTSRTLRLTSLVIPLIILGCDLGPESSPTSPPDAQLPAVLREGFLDSSASVNHFHANMARLARDQIPGYAGHYLSPEGSGVLLLADSAGLDAGLDFVASTLTILNPGTGVLEPVAGTNGRVEVEMVRYDFIELWRHYATVFKGLLETPNLLSQVAYLDIDEAENTVTVAGTGAGFEASVRALASERLVPNDVLAVKQALRSVSRKDLTDDWDTVAAGVRVASGQPCTAGFNAILDETYAGFFTASHCTTEVFSASPDSGQFYQPGGGGDNIGFETWDFEGFVDGYVYGGDLGIYYCNNGLHCRFTDAAFIEYHDPDLVYKGRIARTESVGYLEPGSRTQDSSDPFFGVYIADLDWEYQVVNQWLAKMGQLSGYTRGQIDATCIDPFTSDGIYLLCHHNSDIWSEPGDSGAAIFYDGGTEDNETTWSWIYPTGILFGGDVGDETDTEFGTIQGLRFDALYGSGLEFEIGLWCFADSIPPCE